MSANRAKNSKPEMLLRRALWHAGLKGYRLHHKRVPGRPDISFVGKKLAIFVHGCYWHHCPKCNFPIPKTNTDFWQAKFARNTAETPIFPEGQIATLFRAWLRVQIIIRPL